jgi:hypothetical protein
MRDRDLLRQTILQILAEARTIDSMSFGSSETARTPSIMPTDAGRKILTLARQGEFGPELSRALTDESNLTDVFKIMCYAVGVHPSQYKDLAASAKGMLEPGQEELLRKMEKDRRARTSDVDLDYDPYESMPATRRYSKLDF